MNSSPRQILARIIAKHGREICDSPKRVEALLRDLSSQHRREINILVGALEERVAADLITAGKSVPRDVLLARLTARLRDNLAYTPEAARWGVETWAVALGVFSEDEVKERARLEAATDRQSSSITGDAKPAPAKSSQPNQPLPPPVSQASRPTQTQPKRGSTYAPPKQASAPPTVYAPTPTPPPPIASPAPARLRRTYAPPANVAAAPPVTNTPTVQPSPVQPQPQGKRGITLRGCFITVVVLVVLYIVAVLLVPVVITILQEEQAQPSINEPRIR